MQILAVDTRRSEGKTGWVDITPIFGEMIQFRRAYPGGGVKYVLFSPLFREDFRFD